MFVHIYVIYASAALALTALLIRIPVVSGLIKGFLSMALSLVDMVIGIGILILDSVRRLVSTARAILA